VSLAAWSKTVHVKLPLSWGARKARDIRLHAFIPKLTDETRKLPAIILEVSGPPGPWPGVVALRGQTPWALQSLASDLEEAFRKLARAAEAHMVQVRREWAVLIRSRGEGVVAR